MVFAEISNSNRYQVSRSLTLDAEESKKLVIYLILNRDLKILPVQIVSNFSTRNCNLSSGTNQNFLNLGFPGS